MKTAFGCQRSKSMLPEAVVDVCFTASVYDHKFLSTFNDAMYLLSSAKNKQCISLPVYEIY
jgi:hypothetical protein